MSAVGDRLRFYIESQFGAIKDFCTEHEIRYSGMNSIINNRRPLTMEVLDQVKQALPDIDVDWLLYGTKRPAKTVNEKAKYYLDDIYPDNDLIESLLLKYLDKDSVLEKLKGIIRNVVE